MAGIEIVGDGNKWMDLMHKAIEHKKKEHREVRA